MSKTCSIIGAGISGPVAALLLSRMGVHCTIYELRDAPSNIGGAVNLTPNALRLLEDLEVTLSGCVVDSIEIFSYHTGSKIAELPFRGTSGHAMRISRSQLQRALLDAVDKAGIPIKYGSKLVSIDERINSGKVVAQFESNSSETDFIVGCDGMYSAVRLKFVEPSRIPIYTGVCSAYSMVDATDIKSPIHFQQTAMNAGRFGSLLTSYVDPDRKKVYLAAVMETSDQGSKEGWQARGIDREKTVREVTRRYWDSALPCIPELLASVDEYTFYPISRLQPEGKWSRGKVVLLGDAAHGMPPQGESTGLAIEDSFLFARVLSHLSAEPIESVFKAYESTRRPRINVAYEEAAARWERVKDKTWLTNKIEEWFTWVYMWYKADTFEKNFGYDVRTEEILQ